MARPAKIATSFPSVSETAERLGVSKREAAVLSELAERSQRTGVFAIPGLGHVVRVPSRARSRRNPASGEATDLSSKKVVKFRVVKSAKDTAVPSKKK
jgi:DNA-binding protein HU-beta